MLAARVIRKLAIPRHPYEVELVRFHRDPRQMSKH